MTENQKCAELGCQMNRETTMIIKDGITKYIMQQEFCIIHTEDYAYMAEICNECNIKATRIFDYKPMCETHWDHAFHDLKMKNRYASGNGIENAGGMNMAEQKAVPLDVVVSDKGKKSVRIGKAFINMSDNAKVPLSMTIDLAAVNAAIKDGTVSEQPYNANPQYPDPVLDGKNTLRLAGFRYRKKA